MITIIGMTEVTRILTAIQQGDERAADKLLPLVYQELRRLAESRLSQEKPGQTLQPTALVHEAWLKLVSPNINLHWDGRGHFFAAAARAMQQILVDQARRKQRLKAGGDRQRVCLEGAEPTTTDRSLDLVALDEALLKLENQEPRKAELVRLRYFAGLTLEEAAEALGVSVSTADNDWAYSKSWLRVELSK